MDTIKLCDFGSILATRTVAKQVFDFAAKRDFNVVFDFAGVKFMNSSFADELFAKALVEHGKKFKIINIQDDFIKKMIIFVTESRKPKQHA